MPICKTRQETELQIDRAREKGVSLALFCTASQWNTEAILKAASDYAKAHDIEEIPVSIAMTFNYRHMPQAQRVNYARCPEAGFLQIIDTVHRLCDDEYAPYKNVRVLLHLDHADPAYDEWALYKGVEYLSTVMFDAQRYPYEDNVKMTAEYVKKFKDKVMIEGIMDMLSVLGTIQDHSGDEYVPKALDYFARTGIDMLVADLGTEQQSTGTGKSQFMRQRALDLTAALGKPMLCLHGTSCLSDDQIRELAGCGIIRVNMWTRIAREAGQYAAEQLLKRAPAIFSGSDFNAIESNAYMRDSVDKASEIMYETLDLLGYAKFAK